MLLVALIFNLISFSSASEQQLRSNVLELSDRFLEFKGNGHWFIEFYAPWCGHCKKLHPIWEQVANILAEKSPNIKVGRLDCTRFTNVAHDLDVHGFPTIKYFRNGIEFLFEGDRTREALLEFALRLEGPEVRKISDSEDFLHLHKQHYKRGGLFVLVSDSSSGDVALEKEFDDVAKELFSRARFAQMTADYLPDDVEVTAFPAILTFKDSTYYTFSQSGDLTLKAWVEGERWPLVPLLTYGNLYDMGLCCNKLLAIVVSHAVDRTKSDSSVKKFFDVAKETARLYDKDLHKSFQFCWTDGNEIGNRIATRTLPIPSFLVYNASSYQYYLPQDPLQHTTKESLALFLKSVASGDVQAQGGKGLVQNVKRSMYEIYVTIYNMFVSQPLLSCCLFGLPLGILSIICYTLCSTEMSADRDEVYKDSDGEDEDMSENNLNYQTGDSFREHDKYE